MQQVEIRRPNLEDYQELHHFFRSVITDTFAKENLADLVEDIEQEIMTKERYLKLDYESLGVDRYFLLAVMNEQIIGTIEYGPSSSLIHELTQDSLKNMVEIGTVFVHPKYQQRGIGSLLFTHLLISLRNKGIVEFCLDSGYSHAQKYWIKKLGEPDYWFENYWGEGNDHMIWRRQTNEILESE
ncbi:GNAT family N-acetyltransferase [Paenibacillus sp. D2_2]|uniref:GNAT family N-acetyltransferase n=1 Tax=Paenibacillus sp. D2_2 TaxID=3073092 RepID=UPI002815E304|nr:GNAT family N-acetyltransferase [Paenibacillus sp. D2_2]WMT39587.1 GNAT family N-acetyltransferase [Paenibacillus sp. D2_2]